MRQPTSHVTDASGSRSASASATLRRRCGVTSELPPPMASWRGVRADHGHARDGRRVEGQDPVVDEEHRPLGGDLARHGPPARVVLLELVGRRGRRVEDPDALHEPQDVAHLLVHDRLVDQAVADGGGEGGTEPGRGSGHLEVQAGQGGRRRRVRAEPVRHDEPVEAPLVAEDRAEQVRLLAAVGAVHLVVGGHHGPDAGLLYGVFEGDEVDLPEGTLVDLGADRHPLVLLVVAGVVLDAAGDPAVLHAPHVGDGEAGGEERVLGEGLEGAAGQRRADDADRRAEEDVDVLGAGLGGEDRAEAPDQLGVPRRADGHAARQRQGPAADEAVAPDARRAVGHLERRDAQALDRRQVPQVGAGGEGRLLIEGHRVDELRRPVPVRVPIPS